MEVKAIMCDVDGMLLTSEQVISPFTVEMIKQAREQGILFGLSTGRDVNSVKKLLNVWGIEGLVDVIVGTGGSEIYDYRLDTFQSNYPLDGELNKLIIICDEDYMDKVIERSTTFHNDCFKSSSLKTASELYEYMDPRVTKTNDLIKAIGVHSIDIKEIVTFGDADNDYDMTLNAGVGVVMENGSEKTKSVADAITDDNNHDGIGNYIQKYILK